MNFVGVGDPILAEKMGAAIFEVTQKYDALAVSYIKENPACKYIFLSSGAAYGTDFKLPATNRTLAKFNLNDLKSTDWYGVAKLYAEATHRAMTDRSIIDIRVFNYFSHTQNLSARYFITDVVRAIKSKEILSTSPENLTRDYITPEDFYNLIQRVLATDSSTNGVIDCYTKAPVDKKTMLNVFAKEFGLLYSLDECFSGVNATGMKLNYYSKNKAAEFIGYEPVYSSIDGLISEIAKIQVS